MVKIVFYMNCHYYSLKKYFDYQNIETQYISTYGNIFQYKNKITPDSVKQGIINLLKNVDVLIYNPLNDKYGFWSSNNFINNLKENCLKIKIPYMRTNLYNLGNRYYDLSKFSGKDHKYINFYNIILEVLEHFINNHNEPNEKNIHFLIDYYDNFLKDESNIKMIEKHFTYSLKELKKYDMNSDIPMYDFVEENFKKHKLFLNYDHPSILYFGELFKRIMKLISNSYSIHLKEVKLFGHKEDPLKGTELHIPKYVKIYGNLLFNDDNIGFNGKTWNYKYVFKICCLIKFNKKYHNKFDEDNIDNFINQVKNHFLNI